MIRDVVARLLQAAAVVLLVATLTFVLLHVAPGDPLATLGESRSVPPEVVAQMRRNLGLDQPLYVQYGRYLANLARGDFGVSFSLHRPVWDAFRETVPHTLLLTAAALLVDFTVGIGLGVVQGTRAGSRLDRVLSATTLTLFSMPVFWLGLMLLLLFGQTLGWFPVGGMRDPVAGALRSPLGQLLDLLRHLTLPALTLGLVGAAGTARYQRSALLEIIGLDYVRTARAKGLSERIVLFRHALRNSLLPAITLLGLSLPALLSGTVLVETVFAWPGMGRLSADAIFRRDYPVVTGAAILAAAMVVAGNLLADALYHAVDPRTRAPA